MEGAYVQGIGLFMQEEILVADDGTLISNGTWEVCVLFLLFLLLFKN